MQIVQDRLKLGQNETITCSSIISVDVIEWLNSDGEVIISENKSHQLTLTFEPVTICVNEQQYTCKAHKNGSVNNTIIVLVSGKDYT